MQDRSQRFQFVRLFHTAARLSFAMLNSFTAQTDFTALSFHALSSGFSPQGRCSSHGVLYSDLHSNLPTADQRTVPSFHAQRHSNSGSLLFRAYSSWLQNFHDGSTLPHVPFPL
jgi:hypothetical protein